MYDATLNEEDPAASGFASLADEARFQEEGRALVDLLRAALGDWDVTASF